MSNKTTVPITVVNPTKEYHTDDPTLHNVSVDDRLYFTSTPPHKVDHLLHYNWQNYDAPRVPLQKEDEPEFIKVSVPTSCLPRSPHRRAYQERLNQGVSLQNHLDPNLKRSAFIRRPHKSDPNISLRPHLSQEEESYFDQTTTFPGKEHLNTKEFLERQAQQRYQLQYLNQTKGPKSNTKHPHDSPYPNF